MNIGVLEQAGTALMDITNQTPSASIAHGQGGYWLEFSVLANIHCFPTCEIEALVVTLESSLFNKSE